MEAETLYTPDFYDGQMDHSQAAANIIAPFLLDLAEIKSVCDVGCGVGGWLKAFYERGASDILGIDGDYVPRDKLLIDVSAFSPQDLRQGVRIQRQFDLSMSLEVAEHLPPDIGVQMVKSLTDAAPLVLFSAAIPGQGGTGHINERWQSDWVAEFAKHDYKPIDCIRAAFWSEPRIQRYYLQNSLLYASPQALEGSEALARLQASTHNQMLSVVHPVQFNMLRRELEEQQRPTLGQLARALPQAIGRSLASRMGGKRA